MDRQRNVDRRFKKLMREEFGDTYPGQPDPTYDEFNLTRALEEADPEPDYVDQWHAPDPKLPSRPSNRVLAGAIMLVAAILMGLATLLGLSLPSWLSFVALALFAGGLGVLLSSIPRRWDAPDDHDY